MADPLLQARGIVKNYGHVEALRGCDFDVYPNEIVALIGDNGAGKSTLIKILAGSEQADEGEVFLEGRRIHAATPFEAMQLGIETVYQDLALAPDLDGSANLYLGRELMMPGPLGKLVAKLQGLEDPSNSSAYIQSSTANLADQIKATQTREADQQEMVNNYTSMIEAQFTAMETTLATLQAQSQQIAAQLGYSTTSSGNKE